ncbi:MAG: M48 family metalloprotease, partial [Acidimicrobiales bacterium]
PDRRPPRDDPEEASPATTAPPRSEGARAGGLTVTDAEVRSNRRRALALAAAGGLAFGVVLGVVLGAVAGPVVGGAVGAAVLVVLTVVVRRSAVRLSLSLLGARPLEPGDQPRLENLVEGLCASFGLRVPRLLVVDEAVPNACALGADPTAALVVTGGLLDRLGLMEMEGVVAHELAHVKRHDAAVSAVALAVVGPLGWLTGDDAWLHRAVGRGREYRADQIGAALVRYPPGLHDALASFESCEATSPDAAGGGTFAGRRAAMSRWVWIDPSVGRRQAPATGELDATSVRIEALAEW